MEGMERRLSLKKQFLILAFTLCAASAFAKPEAGPAAEEIVRFSLWATLEAYPEAGEVIDANAPFAHPISRLKEIVPFFVEGMVCGWNFTYVPSDKTRNVEERFEFKPLREYPNRNSIIQYKEPWIEENKLFCWVEIHCPPHLTAWRSTWKTLGYQRISGRGQGRLTDGFDGIYEGATIALKEAVREYARSITKNKPKEITGEVLLTGLPSIGLKSGRYIVDLDFFLNVSRIINYTIY